MKERPWFDPLEATALAEQRMGGCCDNTICQQSYARCFPLELRKAERDLVVSEVLRRRREDDAMLVLFDLLDDIESERTEEIGECVSF